MKGEITLTESNLRDVWVDYLLDPLPRSQGIAQVPRVQAQFDEWIAGIRAQAAADALEQAADEYTNHVGASKARPHARTWLRERAAQLRQCVHLWRWDADFTSVICTKCERRIDPLTGQVVG